MEEDILKFWAEKKCFERSVSERSAENTFYFYDGPPFATGLPHYGHLLASTIKDVIPRYQTMLGKKVIRRFGWDCHGLPVEFEVEKELGLRGKVEIEEMGIDKFNEACRKIVLRYSNEWQRTIQRIGRWVDMENDYKTMDVDFMESIWWVFKTLWEKNLIFESKKIVAYSPRLGTPLSNFEVNLGYKDIQDPAVTLKFKIKGNKNETFLAWTTTPWTLPSNLALAVNPAVTYARVEQNGEIYVLAKELITSVFGKKAEYKIISTCQGEELLGIEYEPLFPYFKHLATKHSFTVLPGEYVTTDAGTGIVHTAPSFGEDDFILGEKYDLPHLFPLTDGGEFNSQAPEFEGMFFKDADKHIMHHLKEKGLVFKHSTVVHSYPFCWRSGAPLMYRTIRSWFLNVKEIKQRMIDNNQKIHWAPEHIKNGRMGKWLEGARDWAISRNRYWGNPIPLWICDSCGHIHCVGSKQELEELSGQQIKDLHSHLINSVTIKCEKCSGTMQRTSEVLDCWFESGAMPYGQSHYPFENKEQFEHDFPADFISEGLDQTRGWFYTLIVLGTALFDKPAFKNCIVSGMLLAEDGKKMSKSLKNYPDPWDMLNRYGADVIRLYMLNSGAIRAEELRFSEQGLKETMRNTTLPLWNVLSFLITYANIDQWEAEEIKEVTGLENPLDRWILSRLHSLIAEVRESADNYELNRAVAPLVGFIDMLTNWYVRRSRRRFWKSEEGQDKQDAYGTLYTVLLELSKLIAPFIPFIAENIYQFLKIETMPESVHLCSFPESKTNWRDQELENEMDIILKSVSMGRSLRAKHELKIRQPLPKVILLTKSEAVKGILGEMATLITDELNVKEVEISHNEEDIVHLVAKPNLKLLGPKLGKKLKDVKPLLAGLTVETIVSIQNGEKITLKTGTDSIEIGLDELFIERHQKDGVISDSMDDLTVALDIQLTKELIDEGYAREFINKIQQTRKEMNLNVTDRIKVKYQADKKFIEAVTKHKEYVTQETLMDSLQVTDSNLAFTTWDMNGIPCQLQVTKI